MRPSNRKRGGGRPLTRQQRGYLGFIMVFALIVSLFSLTLVRVRPMLASLAATEARGYVMRMINRAISDEINGGDLDYDRLVALEKDTKGNITALVTNMALINTLQAEIANTVINDVMYGGRSELSIPLGSAFGGMLLAGRGPKLPVKILSMTNVKTEFKNSFSAAGLNQTRHIITLELTASIEIFAPGCREYETVTAQIPVAETVIVGIVPNIYADLGG